MFDDLTQKSKFIMQDEEYIFPYHYLPYIKGEDFFFGRELSQGAGYLTYLRYYGEYINNLGPSRYLDIGCGDGRLFEFIDKKIIREGCDLSEKAVAFAKAFNPNDHIVCSDISKMPQDYYDVISMIEVIEHIPDDELGNFIANSWKTLKVGGHCIISVPTINLIPVPKKHYRHYTFELLEQELRDSGVNYSIENVEWVLHYDWLYRFLLKLCGNHIVRLEFIRKALWKHTNNSIHSDKKRGIHLFVDLKKNG